MYANTRSSACRYRSDRLMVPPTLLGGDIEDNEAADESDFVEHGVWLRFLWFVRCLRYMLARRVCRRDPLPRRLNGICGRGPQLVWGRSPRGQGPAQL
jgi:hypothetical protein